MCPTSVERSESAPRFGDTGDRSAASRIGSRLLAFRFALADGAAGETAWGRLGPIAF